MLHTSWSRTRPEGRKVEARVFHNAVNLHTGGEPDLRFSNAADEG